MIDTLNIKRSKYIILLFFLLFFSLFLFPKNNPARAESIKNYDVKIDINKNGTVNITEQIVYDFGNLQKHGIFRDINYKKVNQDGKRYKLDIDNLSVSNTGGVSYKFEESRSGNFVKLKIGDPNRTMTGTHTYVIKYTVSGAITYFSDHDELYWNATGNDWEVPIENSTILISLPDGVDLDTTSVVCYVGPSGSTSQNCIAGKTEDLIMISSNNVLGSREGMTFAVSFPNGVVDFLEPTEDKLSVLAIIMIVIAAFPAIGWFLVLPIKILVNSLKERKFTKNNEKIVSAWFEPPQYSDKTVFAPAETGFIIDKTMDHKELTATIIHLAQRGFLKIRDDGKRRFTFIKVKDFESDPSLRNFEKEVLKAIFAKGDEIKDTSLKNSTSFFNKITIFKKYVEDEIMNGKMFEKRPTTVMSTNMVLIFLGVATLNVPLVLSSIFGVKSAKRTLEGVEKYSEAKSLFNFLKSQDEQLNFQAKNQMFFEKLLPYAAGFGVEKVWAEKFKDISVQKPDWYEGSDFTNIAFISAITSNISGSVRSSMTTTTSSSGFSSGFSGGSSGGGGGGGGGGSW